MNHSINQSINENIAIEQTGANSLVLPREWSVNDSSLSQSEQDPILQSEKNARNLIVTQYENEIMNVILNDSFDPGFVSDSENYINGSKNNLEYIREATNRLYLNHYNDSQILTGVLIMMGSLSYSEAEPQGQTMALGLLQHKDISVRDRAIQAFERWNSKKGIPILKSLQCDTGWLQKYVDKVISYLEKDGME